MNSQEGPGLWKFNNTLLEDERYKELIKFYYPQILNKYSEVIDKQLLWQTLKRHSTPWSGTSY